MSTDDSNRKRKPRKPAQRKNTKVTGERSEAAFLHKAANLGFGVAKPWGDSRRYDFIVDNGFCLHRVQVKCTESIRMRAYETRATYTTGNTRAVYTKRDIDFIAAHVVPLDIWYIIPVEICTPAPMLRFYPHRKAKKCASNPTAKPGTTSNPRKTEMTEKTTSKSKPSPTKPSTPIRLRAPTLFPVPTRSPLSSRAKALVREADQHRSRGT
jgi:hypothetical protein